MIEIPLTQNKVTLVDKEFEHLKNYKWCYSNNKALRSAWDGRRHLNVLLHHAIIGFPLKGEVDHINGNSLDNRLINLRIVSHRENMQNTKLQRDNLKASKYIGVHASPVKSRGKLYHYWQARIRIGNKQKYLGNFKNEEDALWAYKKEEGIMQQKEKLKWH